MPNINDFLEFKGSVNEGKSRHIFRKHSIVVSYTTSSWLHYGKHNSKTGNFSQHQKEAELTVVFLSFPKHRDNRPKKNSRKNSFNEISENRLLLSLTEAGVVKEIRPCFYHSACIPNTYRFRLSLLLTIRMKPWITNTTLQLVFFNRGCRSIFNLCFLSCLYAYCSIFGM